MPMPEGIKWPYPQGKLPFTHRVNSRISLAIFGTIAKIWTYWLNTSTVHNGEVLLNAMKRPKEQSLLTAMNHLSCIDDPVVWGALLPWKHFVTKLANYQRWCLVASDVCFKKPHHAWFFSLGRGVPIVRGDGVYQKGMDFLIEKMNNGGWAHTFPEGKINVNHEQIRLKWGVGRLVDAVDHVPMVIPIWQVGMDDILPNKRPYIPLFGKRLTVVVGNPIDLSDISSSMKSNGCSKREIRKALTDKIQDEMFILRQKAESLHN